MSPNLNRSTTLLVHVNSMLEYLDVDNVKHEMAGLGINVLGIRETRWPIVDDCKSDGLRIIRSGEESQQRSSNNIR